MSTKKKMITGIALCGFLFASSIIAKPTYPVELNAVCKHDACSLVIARNNITCGKVVDMRSIQGWTNIKDKKHFLIYLKFNKKAGDKIHQLTASNIKKPLAVIFYKNNLIFSIVSKKIQIADLFNNKYVLGIATIQTPLESEIEFPYMLKKKAQSIMNSLQLKECQPRN